MATTSSPMLQVTAVAAASMAVVACSMLLRRLSFRETSPRPMRLTATNAPAAMTRPAYKRPLRNKPLPLPAVREDAEETCETLSDSNSSNASPRTARRRPRIQTVKHAWRAIQSVGEAYLYTGRGRRELEAAMNFVVTGATQQLGLDSLSQLFTKHPTAAALLYDHVDVIQSTAHARGDVVLSRLAGGLIGVLQQLDAAVDAPSTYTLL
ncbi:hypothetical protein SPRG_19219 [Saprolegnia parasitica CBS 223.65]|uniref:Uncharacterized protein n=1 Tax=Saprolegnia parasitica (strain CBS 223.65) TaxID=695850 RepID=A0A067D3J5_SAPPC|nr:hypothetical protein SPRG_19219 [Saprolegnia parasitica CBS 223.65]KDO33587.1 hypothetical protein SPRG_19219 [Saprolegnia parasitica CBS 223.65]|eukprot:XP_012195639.1 hypothetical protein SPRG_19219 [Saprolegnia parasitica CBS 223.65]